MKKSYLVIVSYLLSAFLVYFIVFVYTFINFDKEFKYTFNSLESLNFHEKYSKKMHHIREEASLNTLFKTPRTEDLLFTKINKIKNKDLIVLFQGDSWMDQLTSPVDNNFISVELVKKFKSKKKVGFINAGTVSHSPSLMNLQLDVLEKDFQILPEVVVAFINQTDIGDEICRYKKNKIYKDGVFHSIKPETDFMGPGWFNYSKIYGLSRIYLNNQSKIAKTSQLINFKIKYSLTKSSKKIYKTISSFFGKDKEKIKKCYWPEIEKYLINPTDADIKYFEDTIKEYLKKIDNKKHIKKLFLVTVPYKKHFETNSNKKNYYKLNISSVVNKVIKNKKKVSHIDFSNILLTDKSFDYENIWLKDNIHFKTDVHGKLFIQKILDELAKYFL
jgi:hypothetical protein